MQFRSCMIYVNARIHSKISRSSLPQGVLPCQEVGGLGPEIKFEAKFEARPSQVHQISGKTWKVLLPQDVKVGKGSQFWGHLGLYLKFKRQNLGYLSPIFLEAKFGASTRISEAHFGAKPSDLLIWKYQGSLHLQLNVDRWKERAMSNLF